MKKIIMVFVTLALSLSMLAGCSESPKETSSAGANNGGTSSTGTKKEETSVSSEMTVTVLNSSGYTFSELYISAPEDSWGSNLLSSNDIEDGDSYDVTLPISATNIFDIKVVDEEKDEYVFANVELDDECEVDIELGGGSVGALVTYSSGATSYFVGNLDIAEEQLTVAFYNRTVWSLMEVFVYESGSPDMGSNLIDGIILLTDDGTDLVFDVHSSYNIDIVDEDGDSWEFVDVYLESDCKIEVSKQADPEMRVTYASGATKDYVGEFKWGN